MKFSTLLFREFGIYIRFVVVRLIFLDRLIFIHSDVLESTSEETGTDLRWKDVGPKGIDSFGV